MYIVVIGLGEVGRHLLSVLDKEGHDVVAIDRDPVAVEYADSHFDVMSLVGYGASEDILEKAGVKRSDLVVSITDHDEVNLIAALAAKQLGARKVVARVQGNEWAKWREGVRYGLLGVDVVLNPRVLVAQELTRIARSHGALEVVDLAQHRIELVKIETTEKSRMLNKPLSKVNMPEHTLIAAVVRGGEIFVPGGADVLLPGDRVYIVGKPSRVLEAEDLFSSQREAHRVCIVGGGVIGESLAESLLRFGAEVMLIERNRERAEILSARMRGLTVVHGDGTDKELLDEEQVGAFDLVAAVTAEDEINLMASLLAKRVGVRRTAAVVQRADYIPIYRQLGVDIALSPRALASDQILRFSRPDVLHNLTVLEDGQAEVVELTAPRACRAIATPLSRLHLPRGALVSALVRKNGEVIIPRGHDEIHPEDTVIIVTTTASRPTIERLFRATH